MLTAKSVASRIGRTTIATNRIIFFLLGQFLFSVFGFIDQNRTFMRITISNTAAKATQNPMFRPSHSVVPKSVIQVLSSSLLHLLKAIRQSDGHKPFQACCQIIYNKIHGSRYAKYAAGSATNPRSFPNIRKWYDSQNRNPMSSVRNVTGADARLWINGSFGVRIIWITNVWLHIDSTNQPAWNIPIYCVCIAVSSAPLK